MDANDPLAEVEQIIEAEHAKVLDHQKIIINFVQKMTGTDHKTALEICARYEQAVISFSEMVHISPEDFAGKMSNDRRLVLLGMVAGAHLCGKVLSFGRREDAE